MCCLGPMCSRVCGYFCLAGVIFLVWVSRTVGPLSDDTAESFAYRIKGIETFEEAEQARRNAASAAAVYGILSAVSFFTWAYQVEKPWARRTVRVFNDRVVHRAMRTVGIRPGRRALFARIGSGVPGGEYELSDTSSMQRPLMSARSTSIDDVE